MKRWLALFVLPVVLLLGARILPLASGAETLCLRDVLNTHLKLKAFGAEALRHGELPLVDPLASGGQPYLGNLNAFPLYPTNLLFLVGSTIWALNAHFWLHWLLAPWGMFALARRWGLERAPAWAAGVLFAFSGYFVSQLNMANLVGCVALAPALAAAMLAVGEAALRRRAVLALGLLWALELLAGDPVTAAIALLVALAAAAAKGGRRAGWAWIAAALCGGTVAAAPQLVELARILPFSYRGFWGYGKVTLGGWDPYLLPEWLLPFAFGRPDQLLFWGRTLTPGDDPLFYSLFPGLLALALAAASGRPGGRRALWAWGAVGLGLVLASAGASPVLRWVFNLPGAGLFRFSVKFWLPVAMGASLLGGLGAQRLLAGTGRRAAGAVLAAAALVDAAVWAFFRLSPAAAQRWIAGLAGERLRPEQVASEAARWGGLGLLGLATALLLGAGLLLLRRRGEAGLAALLALHAATQLFFLQPALATHEVDALVGLPPIAREIPAGAALVNGLANDLFAPPGEVMVHLPGQQVGWFVRLRHQALVPWVGQLHGWRYELDPSPEGLSQFMTHAVALGMRNFSDARRLQVVRAVGVDFLLLDRELEPQARGLVTPVAEAPLYDSTLRLYRVRDPLPEAALLGEVTVAPHMNAALQAVFDPEFDPRHRAVVAGARGARHGPPGEARLVRSAADELVIEARSETGGLLVLRRAYLPIYRGEVDGEPAALRIANLTRLAVEVPAGRHTVRIRAERRPFRFALAAAAVGLLGLLALARAAPPAIIRDAAGSPGSE